MIYFAHSREIWLFYSLRMCCCQSLHLPAFRVCLSTFRQIPWCIHSHLCDFGNVTSTPWLGGRHALSLSQLCIYSGPFEIIELTHLSDGERRNAKRSPGEVPAAPAPNLSCLQIAQSLHHNRWDSCLSFLPCSHTFTDAQKWVFALMQPCQTFVTDKTGKQAGTCTVRICRHTNTHLYSFPLSLYLLLSPAFFVLFLFQVWFPCKRSVSHACRTMTKDEGENLRCC